MAMKTNLSDHWRFEEASGSRVGAHNGHSAVDNNTVTQGAGKIGNAASFHTPNAEYLSLAAHADFKPTTAFTIAFWVKFTSVTDYHMVMISRAGDPDYSFMVDYQVGTGLRMFLNQNFSLVGPQLSANTWYFMMFWYDSVNGYMQVDNGTIYSSAYSTNILEGASPLLIGKRGDAGQYMHGLLDELSFWKNRALVQDDRDWLWNGGAGRAWSEWDAPTGHTASIAATLGAMTASASASHVSPTYTATVSALLGPMTAAASAQHVPPTYTATISAALGPMTAAASAQHVLASYTAIVSATLGPMQAAASATFAPGIKTAVVSAVMPGMTAAAFASVVNPFIIPEVVICGTLAYVDRLDGALQYLPQLDGFLISPEC